jgi:hypothetical protein
LQDDSQRPEQAPPAAAPAPPPPAPAESAVNPHGLEGLRNQPGSAPSGLSALGLTSEHDDPLPFHSALDTSLPYGYEHQEPMYLPLALSVGAGFKFGCGFMLAVGVTGMILFLVLSVLFFVAALIGIPLPGAAGPL